MKNLAGCFTSLLLSFLISGACFSQARSGLVRDDYDYVTIQQAR
jgi:hypothetical protein